MISRDYPPSHVEGASVRHFKPGEAAVPSEYSPGDFILTHGSGFFSYLIRVGQSLTFWGKDRQFTWWSHAALIATADGGIIEAVGAGVRRSNLSAYAETDYHLVKLDALASASDRAQIVHYGEWALGQKYGWLTIFSIACGLIVGGRLTFGFDGQSICSGLVARALERSSAIFNRSPSHIMPADLAKYFRVVRPPPGSSKGKTPKSASSL